MDEPRTPKHVMVDLETMGTTPGSVIASIGAQIFDLDTGELGRAFYAVLDQDSSMDLGLQKDPGTVEWWSRQSEEAQAALGRAAIPARFALEAFDNWWRVNAGADARFWCQGPSFDQALLDAAFRAAGLKTPWAYNSGRDTRTVYELLEVQPDTTSGVLHNALDDARRQIGAVVAGYHRLPKIRPVEVGRPVGDTSGTPAPQFAFTGGMLLKADHG